MKFKFANIAAAVATVFAVTVIGFAQSEQTTTTNQTQTQTTREGKRFGKMHGDHHGEMSMRMLSQLNLTDTQKAQAKTIIATNRSATLAQREELKTLFGQKRSGATLTTEQQTRMSELRDQLRQSDEKTHSDLLALLTTEQRAQLDAKRQEMRQQMQQRRQQRQQQNTTTTTNTTPQS